MQPQPPSQPPPTLTATLAVGYLIARSGQPKLAAVDASRDLNQTITEAQLLATIASDPTSLTSLAAQTRLLVILHVLDAFRTTHTAYMQRVANLTPRDTAKTYTDMASALAQLGGPPTAPKLPDPFDEVLKKLPAEVAEAVAYFAKAANTQNNEPPTTPPDNHPYPQANAHPNSQHILADAATPSP